MFDSQAEPYTYLTVKDFREYPAGDSNSFDIALSDKRRISERSAFTAMMLLGELGGLYGALVGIPSYFISHFVQLSFMSAIT